MNKNISVGIDIGTSITRIVVGEFSKGEKNPRIIGIGESPTSGLRHGYIVNTDEATQSVKSAIALAEKTSGIKIRKAFISINTPSLKSEITSGEAIISKADGEVTNLDINKALKNSENNLNLNNKKIIHKYPLSFKLDGKEVLGRIEGMKGTKLEIKSIFITASLSHCEDLIEVLIEAGIEPINIVSASIAGSYLALTEKQKIVGSALVNIGSETMSLAIFENGSIVHLNTFSIGSVDITNDIALGLRISLEEAELCKIQNDAQQNPKKKLDEIVKARLFDMFELIENSLKKIKRNELLPAGIVFIGGGASTAELEELSKNFLKLPTKVGSTEIFGNTKTKLRDNSWFIALGLLMHSKNNEIYRESSFPSIFKDLKNSIKLGLKQLIP
jgi:cell division protein FtsA